jgi:predicted HD phosphohydrolase
MNSQEVAAFEANEFAADALRLRRWDDLAKEAQLEVPGLARYRRTLESVMRPVAEGAVGS